MSKITSLACLLVAIVAVNAQYYYYNNPQRSYVMASPYGSYNYNYNTRSAYPTYAYGSRTYSPTYGPRNYATNNYYSYGPQRQAYNYGQGYTNSYYPYYNYYNQNSNYNYNYNSGYGYYPYYNYASSSPSYAYSAPNIGSIMPGPPNALVSAHLFCLSCGRGRQ